MRCKTLLQQVKAFEGRLMGGWRPGGAKRLIQRLNRCYAAGCLALEVSVKEVNGEPRFLTFTFVRPQPAAFIFISYDARGKRYINRKGFDQMCAWLEERELATAMGDLLEAEAGPQAG